MMLRMLRTMSMVFTPRGQRSRHIPQVVQVPQILALVALDAELGQPESDCADGNHESRPRGRPEEQVPHW